MTVGSSAGAGRIARATARRVVVKACEVAPATRNRGAASETEAALASRLPLPVNSTSLPALPVTAAKPASVLVPAPKVSVSLALEHQAAACPTGVGAIGVGGRLAVGQDNVVRRDGAAPPSLKRPAPSSVKVPIGLPASPNVLLP